MTGKLNKINGAGPTGPQTSRLILPTSAKVGRNVLCPCGSDKKYKKCCGAPPPKPDETIPPCSVKDCEQEPKYFLSPSVDGYRSAERYWVGCEEHHQAIAASAAQVGMDVAIVPLSSIEGNVIALGGLDPVDGEAPAEEGEADDAGA